MSLPAEPPAQALAADEALLQAALPAERWWVPASPAVVLGLGLHARLSSVIDATRCQTEDVAILTRRAGGGIVLLDNILCGAIAVPTSSIPSDVTESYRWLGDHLAGALRAIGVNARRVDVAEARASEPLADTCYGALSPHEVVVDGRKLVGLAQVRRRHAALFQVGILLRDQSALAEFLHLPGVAARHVVEHELQRRTVGLQDLTDQSVDAVVAAVAGARPYAP